MLRRRSGGRARTVSPGGVPWKGLLAAKTGSRLATSLVAVAYVLTALGPWGVLPIVVPLFAFVAARLGALAFAGVPARIGDRAVAGVILAFALAIAGTGALAALGVAKPLPLVGLLAGAAAILAVTGRRWRFVWPRVDWDPAATLLVMVALSAIALAIVSARWLPVWQWDSLGYHLPFVHFTLASGGLDGVPGDLEYIATYPHDVELFFVALRACLPDDRLIDLGQVPFGMGGAIVVGALARRAEATSPIALAAGAAWLVVPAVFLQLPTDYVDVATATFLLAAVYFALLPPTPRSILLAGVALGLFIGGKPSAPLPGAALFVLIAVESARARQARVLLVAAAIVVLLGGESYLANIARHHNPIWPVRVDVGPLHLPGLHPLRELLAAGAAAPHVTGPLPSRFVRSLVSVTSPPAFDMRVGGFGPLFLLVLPLGLWTLARDRSVSAWAALGTTLLSPDPAVARYVLAFPGFILAMGSPWLSRMSPRARLACGLGVGVLAGLQLVYASRGLGGEGPPLWSYAQMTDDERALAVGADGPPVAIDAARRRVRPDESFAFDENMDLCDLAWDLRQSYRVVFVGADLAGEALDGFVGRESVRVLAVGDQSAAGEWAMRHPLQFERLSALPACRKGSCSLFVRR